MLDSSLPSEDILVNTNGDYAGVELLDGDEDEGDNTASIQIESSGAWTIKLAPLADTTPLPAGGKISGTVTTSSHNGPAAVASMTFHGGGNFNVDADTTADFPDNLANEIGNWSGQVPMPKGPQIIVVQASGELEGDPTSAWTLSLG